MSTTTKAADVRTIGKREAQQITAGLKAAGRSYAEAALTLQRAVAEAQSTNVHQVMGYASFTAYLQATLTGVTLPRMTRDEREALIVGLYDAGLGQRVIGGILGVSAGTVNGDLKAAQGKGRGPKVEGKVTTTTDGKQRTRKARPADGTKVKDGGSKAASSDPASGSLSVKVSAAIKVTGAVKTAVMDAKAHRAQILKASATERATAAKNLRESIAQAQALLQAIESADEQSAVAKAA